MSSESTSAVRFLSAFSDIEHHFARILKPKGHQAFTSMARELESMGLLTANQLARLEVFADLRNAISHGNYRDGAPIADPRPDLVADIERVRQELLDPLLAISVIKQTQIHLFTPDNSLSDVLDIVRTHGISQFPIYDDGVYTALLTTTMITQWLAEATHSATHNVSLDTVMVADILAFARSRHLRDHAVFADRTITAAQAIAAMRDPTLPRVLIITETGQKSQRPIRIIGAADVLTLIEHVSDPRTGA